MPDLPLVTIVSAALAVTLAYTVFGLTGFGAAIVGVPLLAHVVPIRFAVPMMLVFDLCAGLLLGLKHRRDDRPFRHECHKASEERPRFVNVVEAFSFAFR